VRDDLTAEEKNELFIRKFKVDVAAQATEAIQTSWHKHHNEAVSVGFTLNGREWY